MHDFFLSFEREEMEWMEEIKEERGMGGRRKGREGKIDWQEYFKKGRLCMIFFLPFEMRDYRFKIEYKMGKKNVIADQLSRPVRMIHGENEASLLGKSKEEAPCHSCAFYCIRFSFTVSKSAHFFDSDGI